MFDSERKRALWLRGQITKHDNLVDTAVDDADSGTEALVFEYCNCGDIRRLVSRCKDGSGKLTHLNAFEALTIAVQLCEGLAALHQHKIVHRDLALRNLFVHCHEETKQLSFKIGGQLLYLFLIVIYLFVDFGLCLDLGDIGATDEAVKYGIHVAPEKVYSEQSDIYSLGLVLYGLSARL